MIIPPVAPKPSDINYSDPVIGICYLLKLKKDDPISVGEKP